MAAVNDARALKRLRLNVFRIIERYQPDETAIMVAVAVVVGVCGGFGAILFRQMVGLFQGLAIGHGEGIPSRCWGTSRGGRRWRCR